MPTIDSRSEARRQQLARMLADKSRAKNNGLEEGDARKHLMNRERTPSVSQQQLWLMQSVFESGSHRNDLNENNAWKAITGHRGTLNAEQLTVATAIIEEGRKGNGFGELPALKLVLNAKSLNATQADVLLHVLRKGGDKDWDFVTITGHKRLGGSRFNNWVASQVAFHSEITPLQAACVKALVDQTRRQVNSPALQQRFQDLMLNPPLTQSQVDARIASYQLIK